MFRKSLTKMGEKTGFTSYIGLDSLDLKDNNDKNGTIVKLEPKLLSGEIVVGSAVNVIFYAPLTEREQGKVGSLFVTNYKLTFVMADTGQMELPHQRNMLLGVNDVALSNVSEIWLTESSTPNRKTRLLPNGPMPKQVKGLQIICKNLKVLTFHFRNSPMGQGRTIAMALIHHAFPKRHHLLFAYEYKEPYYPTLPNDMNMFLRPNDWRRELERCNCPYWRITCINGTSEAFMNGAGETLIVPNSLLDFKLIETSRHFRSGRLPIWVWGRTEGAALLRSGELQTENSAKHEGIYLEHVRKLHPKLSVPHVIYLCGNPLSEVKSVFILPTLTQLQHSYTKFTELFTPSTLRKFWEQDSNYYSILDSSRWLRYVSTCLMFADEAANKLEENITVVLQEGDGMDYSAIVSSLTQILLDPCTRSMSGFQSLIQKEWVSLGHPFCDRLGHLMNNSKEKSTTNEQQPVMSPVFLLFLDCCYQLVRQFPAIFQFTDIYLTTLWDTTHNHVFDTFLFNCVRDRDLAVTKGLIQRPVWDWGEQFTEHDIALFYNPLYQPAPPSRSLVIDRLQPSTCIVDIELWSQCYERWLSPLDLPSSGYIQYHIHNHHILKEIHDIQQSVSSENLIHNHRQSTIESRAELSTPRELVSRFYPFTSGRLQKLYSKNLDALRVSLIDASQLLDSQSLLNAPD